MKTIIFSFIGKQMLTLFAIQLGCISFLALQSCQKDEIEKNLPGIDEIKTVSMELQQGTYITYFGPETFTITSKQIVNVTRTLASPDFEYLDNFILKVKNGNGGSTRVNKVEIIIDGAVLVNHTDFKGNKLLVSKPLSGLTSQSILEVKLDGSKGRFITISIEGMLKPGTITDIDGNYYRIVEICGKWWMAENLRTTRFNDGTQILNVTDNTEWEGLGVYHTPAYCWYNNDFTNKNIYGALYNEGAVSGVNGKNVCPVGWHLAHEEWFTMIHCLDPDANDWGTISEIAGNMVNETGTVHWNCSDNPSTNQTGLTVLPGGSRYINEPPFNGIGEVGIFWTGGSGKLQFYCGGLVTFSEGWDDYGLAVRCIKDE